MARKMEFNAGFPIPGAKLMTAEEGESCDYVACALWDPDYPAPADSLEGVCSLCGSKVIFSPKDPKSPPKICLPCVRELATATEQ